LGFPPSKMKIGARNFFCYFSRLFRAPSAY
jgi:hypothetical protein